MIAAVLTLLLAQAPLPADTPSRYDAGPRQAIAAARERWAKAGLTAYTFTIVLPCHHCPLREIRVAVRQGNVFSAAILSGHAKAHDLPKPLPPAEWHDSLARTIPELFDLADTWLQDRRLESHATFDERYGFPDSVSYMVASMEACCVQGIAGFAITDFKAAR
jgi:hypothetical protein